MTREAYSHEVSSAGFWPGNRNPDGSYSEATFCSYAYPTPDGFGDRRVEPDAASWNADLGEFVLPYAAVAASDDPAATLMAFLQSTYGAAADLADWDREALECDLQVPRMPRAVGATERA